MFFQMLFAEKNKNKKSNFFQFLFVHSFTHSPPLEHFYWSKDTVPEIQDDPKSGATFQQKYLVRLPTRPPYVLEILYINVRVVFETERGERVRGERCGSVRSMRKKLVLIIVCCMVI